jgi:mono/diheme cytochrome c family protein
VVARQEGAALSVYHFKGGDDSDDEGLNARQYTKLVAGKCDLVLGYPLDLTHGALPGDFKATAPYDQTGFVLVVTPPAVARGLADLPPGSDVAVTYLTAPNLYFADHPNVQANVEHTEKDTLQSLLDGHVKAAIMWQATLTQFIAAHPGTRLDYRLLHEPHARWNIVALYGPAGAAAAAEFDRAIAALRAAGTLPAVAEDKPERHADTPFIHRAAWQMAVATLGTQSVAGSPAAALPTLYTQAQADDGLSQYSANCAKCHGDNLQGRSGPALTGKHFATEKSAYTVGDVFHIVAQNMPAAQPGSLAHDDYVQIMAFLLQQNGYPAGKTPLKYDDALNSTIALRYHGP